MLDGGAPLDIIIPFVSLEEVASAAMQRSWLTLELWIEGVSRKETGDASKWSPAVRGGCTAFGRCGGTQACAGWLCALNHANEDVTAQHDRECCEFWRPPQLSDVSQLAPLSHSDTPTLDVAFCPQSVYS